MRAEAHHRGRVVAALVFSPNEALEPVGVIASVGVGQRGMASVTWLFCGDGRGVGVGVRIGGAHTARGWALLQHTRSACML